jgi:hypothetical protein
MKKYIYNIYLLAALFLVATACTKEDSMLDSSAVEKEQPVNKTYTLTVNASKGEDIATTRALTLDGSTLNSTWEVNDEVTVYNVTKSEDLGGTLKAQSAGTSTTLTGTLTGTIENGDELTLKFRSPNYASQNGTLAYIAANCDYAKADVKVTAVSGGNVTTKAASFANQQAIVKFTLKDKGNSGALLDETTKLAVTVGSNSYTITPASPTSELFVAIPAFSGQITLNAIVGTKVYTYTKTGVTFTNSQYYTIGVKMTHQGTIEIGKVIGQNGCIYENEAAATAAVTTAVARIAYVGNESNCQNGLAIALADESETKTYSSAVSTASGHTSVPGGIWRLPSKSDWEHMTTFLTAHHQGLKEGDYWASDSYSTDYAYRATVSDDGNSIVVTQVSHKNEGLNVRAVLAF